MIARKLIRGILDRIRPAAYTHVISLGDNCEPSFQIERHFQVDDAYPFDRWVTPLDGAALYLESLETTIYGADGLAPMSENGVLSGLRNKRYDIRFYHEFPQDNSRTPAEVLPGWEASVPVATSRTAHLVEKFRLLDSKSNYILFVRRSDWVSAEPTTDGRGLTRENAFRLLVQALERRFSSAAFDLLCVNFMQPVPVASRGRVFHVDIPENCSRWQGPDDLWSQAFDGIGARLQRRPSRKAPPLLYKDRP